MKIVLFGATGRIGKAIAKEASSRGHTVTSISSKDADVTNPDDVAKVASGHGVVISAVGPTKGEPPSMLVNAARALVQGVRRSGVKRLLVVGGAGSLYVKPGLQLVDAPEFPDVYKPVALAHREALAVYREANDLEWTYVSPAAVIEPGPRAGRYRVGTDQLILDASGQSRISIADYALAFVDELESGRHKRTRIGVAH